MPRTEKVMIGLVKEIDDKGQVKVAFPVLSSKATTDWIRVASPMAGKDRGYFYMPEVDDEALVLFHEGDVNHPFVIGFLHNGVDTAPTKGADKHVRRVRSQSGHVFDLDDRKGKEKIVLTSQGGHRVELSDGDAVVKVMTKGGQSATLADKPGKITLATSTGTTVKLQDTPSSVTVRTVAGVTLEVSDTGVTVTSASAPVSVTAPTASVTATGSVSVTAPSLTLSAPVITLSAAMVTTPGVLQCSTLITGAVVSGSYTPGVGNLL